MRKRRIKLLNNKYIIAYHIKLIKEQRYFSKAKLHYNVFRLTSELYSPGTDHKENTAFPLLPRNRPRRKHSSPIVASAIVPCVWVAKQRLRLRPQRARHNMYHMIHRSRHSSVGIATGWTARVRFPAWVHTGPGAHPASYPLGIEDDFPRDKASWAWSWPPSSI
jgi:hypothetical protein